MKDFTVSPPNTCGLVILPANLVFINAIGAITGAPDDATFEEFLTVDEAAARAVEIDPSYNLNNIYGPLVLTPVNVSDSAQAVYVGDNLVVNCEYECADATVTYQWLNPGNLPIPNATTSSLSFTNLTERLDGTYTCQVSASNAKGQTGSAGGSFTLTVYPNVGGVVAE
jgi:hypothetical protein